MMTVRLKVKNKDFDPDEPPELHEDVEKPEDEDIFRGVCEKEKQSHEAECRRSAKNKPTGTS